MPVVGPPLPDGAILINGNGRLECVGRGTDVPCPDDVVVESFPRAAVLPGLVNAHTHLELTGVGEQIRERSFFDWIQRIRATKDAADVDWFRESARRGVHGAWCHGTTTVADTGDSGAVVEALTELGGSGVVYHEVFGPHPDQVGPSMEAFEADVTRLRDQAGSRVRVGVSPHAPYSVSPPLYRAVAEYAARENLPVAMHLAESRAEVDLVTVNGGPFAAMWSGRDIPPVPPARTVVDHVRATGILDRRPLVIHAVQVDATDARLLADAGASVALCPGSNRAHGHGDPPVQRLREAGIPMGVGTDSVASVGSLDLFREARMAMEIGDLSSAEGIALITSDGARALGLEADVGSLEPGKWADLCIVELPDPAGGDLLETLLGTHPHQILRTYGGGRCLYARSA